MGLVTFMGFPELTMDCRVKFWRKRVSLQVSFTLQIRITEIKLISWLSL